MSIQYAMEHIGLAAHDTTALKDWYVRALGARVIYQSADTPAAYFIELPGGAWIEIYQAIHSLPQTADNKLAGWRHLALRVESVESAKGHLGKKGIRFSEEIKPAGGGGRVLFFQDPEGNLVHLVERPSESPFRLVASAP
jgi:glyoxylase I family protein